MMKFKKRETLDEISLGENEGSVFFDSDTGNFYVLDDIASNIMGCFNVVNDIESVIAMLVEEFEGERCTIEMDIRQFISRLVEQCLIVHEKEI